MLLLQIINVPADSYFEASLATLVQKEVSSNCVLCCQHFLFCSVSANGTLIT